MRLTIRLLIMVTMIIVVTTLLNLFVLRNQVRTYLEESQLEWVETLVSAMVEGITKDTINGNKLPVSELLFNLTENDEAIEYAYVTDMDGRLFAHSFHGGVPRFIADDIIKRSQEGERKVEQTIFNTRQGVIIEYSTPLIEGLRAKLHLGLNSSEINGLLNRVTRSIGWIILLVGIFGFLLASILGFRISRPLREFTSQLTALAKVHHAELPVLKTRDPDIQKMVNAFRSIINARDFAEKEARLREQNLSLTLDSIGDGVIVTNSSGQVTRMNVIAEQLTGWKHTEAEGVRLDEVFKIINASTREEIETPVNKVLSTGNIVTLSNHTTLISKDGNEYQIADSAAPIVDEEKNILGVILVFHDVTEQYQLREIAAKNAKGLADAQRMAHIGNWELDIRNNKLTWSDEVYRIFEVNPENFEGIYEAFLDTIHPDDREKVNKAYLESLKTKSSYQIEHRLLMADSRIKHVLEICETYYDDEGNPIRSAGTVQDITEQKNQEEQLRRIQKMDALGKLTGGIAHDYNNLLGIILGYAEQLGEQLEHNKKHSKYAQSIINAALRGSKLTGKLLAFSRNKTLDTKVLDINEILIDQKLVLEKTLTARIHLTYNLADSVWPVELNSGELEDVILNLSINAQHAMAQSGELTISTSNVTLDQVDASRFYLNPGDYVQLSFSDTGSGMDIATKEKIFDPFFTTKGDQGTGLGLSQVYGFIERSGGAIVVYSELGHGSRFVIYLPRSQQSHSEAISTSTNISTSVGGGETLLVVDDEKDMLDLAHDILSERGYSVLTAEDGLQALDVLEKHNEKIALIITDVIMPEMDGYQLAIQVKRNYPQIKIQMVSGFTDERHTKQGDETLIQNILYKPYTSKDLLTRVRSILDEEETTTKPENGLESILTGRTIIIMDDEVDVRGLFKLNLERLGCNVLETVDGDSTIALYQSSIEDGKVVDIIIMDLSIPGGLGGMEVAKQIRDMDPHARLIVSSGDLLAPEMTRYQEYGFNGAIEKPFKRSKLKEVLVDVLLPT